jgi:hypothetical protein
MARQETHRVEWRELWTRDARTGGRRLLAVAPRYTPRPRSWRERARTWGDEVLYFTFALVFSLAMLLGLR